MGLPLGPIEDADYKVRIYRRQPLDPIEASVGTIVEGSQEQPETHHKKAYNEAFDTSTKRTCKTTMNQH